MMGVGNDLNPKDLEELRVKMNELMTFDKVLEEFIKVSNLVKGVNFLSSWEGYEDAELLGKKMLSHILCAKLLFFPISVKQNGAEYAMETDYSSVHVLLRAAIEAYLTFHFIFIAPKSSEMRDFRFKYWRLNGLKKRVKSETAEISDSELEEEINEKIDRDNQYCQIILDELITNKYFKQRLLEVRDKNKFQQGESERCGYFWNDLANEANFTKCYFKHNYWYLCDFSHSGYISILQQNSEDNEEHIQMSLRNSQATMKILIAIFTFDYLSFFNLSPEKVDELGDLAACQMWSRVGTENIQTVSYTSQF